MLTRRAVVVLLIAALGPGIASQNAVGLALFERVVQVTLAVRRRQAVTRPDDDRCVVNASIGGERFEHSSHQRHVQPPREARERIGERPVERLGHRREVVLRLAEGVHRTLGKDRDARALTCSLLGKRPDAVEVRGFVKATRELSDSDLCHVAKNTFFSSV